MTHHATGVVYFGLICCGFAVAIFLTWVTTGDDLGGGDS